MNKNIEDMEYLKDRIRGSLVGGAIGDALGYPVEFMYSYKEIQQRYGKAGITRLDTRQHWLPEEEQAGKAAVSDDTQMTLYTANGLLNAKRLRLVPRYTICTAYIEWYLPQVGKKSNKFNDCWINKIPELNKRRAPGRTCTTALEALFKGRDVYNDSKGNGGVMRIAPIPLYGAVDNRMSIEETDHLAAEAAEITHKHPLGYIPAAMAAHVIYRLAIDIAPSKQNLKEYIIEGMNVIKKMYPNNPMDICRMEELVSLAILYSSNEKTDVENVEALGGGWVGEEALAISLYCSLRHFDNFENAVIAAVNHGGDSDSTGAITGNILGAAVGYDVIPEHFKTDLELHNIILHMADDLFHGEIS